MTPTLPELIDAAYPGLAPQERRVADLLRTRPELGLLATSSELARTSGVSKATVSRLLRRLGFEDARAARAALREQRAAGVPVRDPALGDPVSAHLEQDVANLRTALAGIEAAGLRVAARAVADARQVLVLGHRSGRPFAALLASALQQVRPGVHLVPEAGQTLAEHLVDLGERDVVVVVDLRRRSTAAAQALAAVAASPAAVLLLADPSVPHDGAVRWRFDLPVGSPSAFDSYAAVASVVSLLAGAVLERLGDAGADRVAAIDRRYRELGELVPSRRSS
ncbi:MAG TPA: SIS domain-containing protein [Amnibacterium sp.]|uniref:MurR/RpiR family transcriptional regulator n=1 Tax=Amnibacterium sp. TaxID=1872496 RepID=UPI002F923B80